MMIPGLSTIGRRSFACGVALALGLCVRLVAAEPEAGSNAAENEAEDVKAQFAQYRTWKPTTPKPVFVPGIKACGPPDSIDAGPHDSNFINVFVSPNARELFVDGKPKSALFPKDCVIVKEKLGKASDGKPTELGVMIKRQKGYSPETGDWQYLFVGKDGKLVTGKRLENCSACHAHAKNDSVFGHSQVKN